MAYHSARPRDPFLDEGLNRALTKRGLELAGLAMLGLALALGVTLWAFMPDAPGLLSPAGNPDRDLPGMIGTMMASGLLIGFGLGAWVFVVFAAVWGLRLVTHTGSSRFVGRLFPLPSAPFIASVHLASFATPPDWPWGASPGLGGTFGDVILGALVNMVPADYMVVWFKGLSFASALALVAILAVILGVTWGELRRALRVLWAGLGLILRGIGGIGPALRHGVLLVGSGLARRSSPPVRHDPPPAEAWAEMAYTETDHAGHDPAPVMPPMPPHQAPHQAPQQTPRAPATDWTRQTPVAAVPKTSDLPREEPLTTMSSSNPWAVPVPTPGLLNRVGRRRAAQVPTPDPAPVDPHPAPVEPEPRETFITQAVRRRLSRARQPEQAPPQPDHRGVAMPVPPAGPATLRAEPPLMGTDPMPQEHLPGLSMETDAPGQAPDLADTISVAVERARHKALTPDRPAISPEADTPDALARQPQRPKHHLSSRARSEAQPSLFLDDSDDAYAPPPLALLTDPQAVERPVLSRDELDANARMLQDVLGDYGVKGEIVNYRAGPVVTLYELEPAPGLKASRVIGLADDIARSMSALSARVSTVPGRSVIGIELPNIQRETVVLREILSGRDFGDSTMRLPLALGKDIGGETVVANLAKMPHLLIAGTTGSGKSVAINTMILSLLYKLSPDECRLIMIDPKMLELSVYDGIPHLLSPVVTDPKKAVVALKWVVSEMEERYRKMSKMGVRNIDGYNSRVRDTLARGEMFSRTVQTGFDEDTGEPIFETEEFEPKTLPYIVVVVDEMADLMMVAGKEIEACIQRLAQMARASGIHLIMATQRPSVDVITGTIKANFPTRISFQVTSKVDSRTILGEQGAEQLLGMGDMLYMAGGGKITRVHGPFVSDTEVEEVVAHLKSYGPPDYVGGVVEGPDDDVANTVDQVLGLGGNTSGDDALYDQAVQIVLTDRKCSTSYIQRKLAIGYNKAARLVERMEDEGIVSAANHVGKREILVPAQSQ